MTKAHSLHQISVKFNRHLQKYVDSVAGVPKNEVPSLNELLIITVEDRIVHHMLKESREKDN